MFVLKLHTFFGLLCFVFKHIHAQCTANPPVNGDVNSGVTAIVEGNDATYTCTSGFTLDGTSPLTCTGGVLGTGTEPTCEGDCSATAPANGLVDDLATSSATHTNTVTYSCNGGYILTSAATLTCTSGSLVGTVPSCVGGCTATAPANGLVDGAPTVSVTDTNTVTYSCNGGYILTSAATLTCTSGSLVGTVPSCVGGCTATAPANGLVDGAPTVSVTDTNTVTYSCNSGYILTSAATLTCTSGSLVGTVPSCVGGCTATAPANGLVDGAPTVSVTDTNTVTYSCNVGYILSSAATLTCTSGGLVGTVPSCVGGCTATAPANGLVDGAPTVSVTDTNTVTYSCNSGYILTSAATLTCTSGSLVGTVPSCVVGCTATAPANGLVDGAPTVSVTDTNTVTYSCNVGYILSAGATLTCTSGSLVGTVPFCLGGCTATAPTNGLVDGAPTVSVSNTNTVTYSCNGGYTLSSGATLTCTSGSLVGTVPTCDGDSCTPAAPVSGTITPTTVTHGSDGTYACNAGFILSGTATQTCTAGAMVGTTPTCNQGCTATAPANGLVDGAPAVSVSNTNTVTYSCNSGYTLSSGATLTCTSGSLVGTVPTCNGDSCTPTAPGSGTITPTTVTHDSDGTYACNSGYTITGTATQTCSAGAMSGSIPTCNQDCTTTVPENGAVTATTVIHGATITYSCNTGYIIQGAATATCNNNAWTSVAATCASGCTATAPANGLVDSGATASVLDGSTITFTCDTGYSLSSGGTLTCTAGSLGTVPTCAGDSCTPAAPGSGTITPTTVPHGSDGTYACNSGYTLDGIATQICLAGAMSGSIPTCNQDCTTTVPANGAVTATTVIHGATITYSCNTGYIIQGTATATCNNNAWTSVAATCASGCTHTAPANGQVNGGDTASVLDGNTIAFTCDSGYTLSSGSGVLTCTTGSLGTVPTCDGNSCTASNPGNGAASGTPIAHGSTVTYTCNSGYGVVGSATSTCTAGNFSPAAPTCETAPVFAANAPTTESVDENTAVGATVTSVITATGPADLTYALTSQTPDSSPKVFAVDATSGLLTITTSPDYETATEYTLVITVTSSKSTANVATDDTSAEHTITVTIVDVAEGSAAMMEASILTMTLLILTKYL